MSKGTKTSFVNSNLYVAVSGLGSATTDVYTSPIPDAVRYFSGNFWTAENGKFKHNIAPGLYQTEQINSGAIQLKADKARFIDENNFINGVLTRVYDQEKWKTFTQELFSKTNNQIFEDLYMDFDVPVNIPEIKHASPSGVNYINREFVYNFYAPEFETLITDQFFDVRTLPTVYSVFTDKQADIKTEKENLELSLGGYIAQSYVDQLSLSKDPEKVSDYFQQYAKTYNLSEVVPVINRLKQVNNVTLLDDAALRIPAALHKKFIPFPFYTSLEFTNPAYTQDTLYRNLKSNGNLQADLLNFMLEQFTVPEENMIASSGVVSEVSVPYYNFKTWLNSNLGNYKVEGDFANSSPKLYTNLTNLLSYIKKSIKVKTREYKDLSNSCHNQILFYRITKHQFNYDSTPVQTWYLMPSETSLVQFYDTQVKYGVDYYYKVTAMVLAVGNSYKYVDDYYKEKELELEMDIANGIYKVHIQNSAIYKIFEIPYAKFTGTINQEPLTKPVVSFKMLDGGPAIYIEQSPLETYEEFEAIENGEIAKFEKIRISQDNEKPETIHSSHIVEGDYKTIQIYKLLQKPISYSAYQGKLYKSLLLKPNENIIYESLNPNKYYYYLFRYVNAHGTPSNVSAVYKVILRDEEGTRYIESEILDLKPEYVRSKTKTFKKYLLIRPSALQLLPSNEINPEKVEDVVLGPNDVKVWDKSFLLKIRSIKSGRVLNYTFKAKIDKRK